MEWNPGRTGSLQRPVTLAQGEPFLPLSWRIETGLDHPRIQRVALPGQIADWLAFGSVPPDYGPRQLAHWLQHTQCPHPFVLRGSHPALLTAWNYEREFRAMFPSNELINPIAEAACA